MAFPSSAKQIGNRTTKSTRQNARGTRYWCLLWPILERSLLPTGCGLSIWQRVPVVHGDVTSGISHLLEWPFRLHPFSNGRFEFRLQSRLDTLFRNPESDGCVVAFLGTWIDVDASHFKFLVGCEDAVCKGGVVLKLPLVAFQFAIILSQGRVHRTRAAGPIDQCLVVLLENHRVKMVPDVGTDLRRTGSKKRVGYVQSFFHGVRKRSRGRGNHKILGALRHCLRADGIMNPPWRVSYKCCLQLIAGFYERHFRCLAVQCCLQDKFPDGRVGHFRVKFRLQSWKP